MFVGMLGVVTFLIVGADGAAGSAVLGRDGSESVGGAAVRVGVDWFGIVPAVMDGAEGEPGIVTEEFGAVGLVAVIGGMLVGPQAAIMLAYGGFA